MTTPLSSDVRRAWPRSFTTVSPGFRAVMAPSATLAAVGLLGAALAPRRARPVVLFASGTALAWLALRWTRARAVAGSGPWRLERAITIARSPDDVFRFLADVDRWPRFSTRLVKLTPMVGSELEWTEHVAGGLEVRWSVRLDVHEPGRSIAWVALAPGMEERGTFLVSPAPGGRGSEVRAVLEYGGRLSRLRGLGRPFGRAPRQVLAADLRSLKRILELGEPLTEARPSTGRRVVVGASAPEGGL
jgi:uncharacterized membrane protein